MTFKTIPYNRKKIFEVTVVATTSSGKSTLINSLIGDEILPSINQACTARTIRILDKDNCDGIKCNILYSNGKTKRRVPCSPEMIKEFNQDESEHISDFVIECDIQGVHNVSKSLMITDTPGINNSLNIEHGRLTKNYLRQIEEGLILYLINADHPSIDDDRAFMRFVRKVMDETPKLQTIFVLNKADNVDPCKESLEEMIITLADLLTSEGFENPYILPVSSRNALLIKKAMRGAYMTETEKTIYESVMSRFDSLPPNSSDLRTMVWDSRVQRSDMIRTANVEHKRQDLLLALEYTGIPLLEKIIETELLLASSKKNQRSEKKDIIKDA